MIFLGGAVLKLWRGCQFTRWHWVLHAMASHLILEWKISFGVLDKKSKPKDWSWRRPPSTCRRPLCKTQRIASHAQGGLRSHSAVIQFSFIVERCQISPGFLYRSMDWMLCNPAILFLLVQRKYRNVYGKATLTQRPVNEEEQKKEK